MPRNSGFPLRTDGVYVRRCCVRPCLVCGFVYLAFVLAVALAPGAAVAGATGSLWVNQGGSLFVDHKANRTGDLITVLIVERSYASNKAQTGTGKGAGVTVAEGVGAFSFLPETGFSANTKSSGQAATSRAGNLVAKMTARIAEALPDGNLRIEGTQAVSVNRERQNIVITGVIRPQDIGADNTILSTYIANAEIRYEGAVNTEQGKGLLSFLQRFFYGILNFIF